MSDSPQEIIALSAAQKVTTFMDPAVWGQMKAMAETLRQSGMLPQGLDTVPKILVVMQTGFENGLKPMEAFGSLYVVNGAVNYYGKATVRRLREHGWRIEYKDEDAGKVTAVVTNMRDEKESYTETYTFDEAVKSGYTKDGKGNLKFGWKEGFNRRLKLRYGVLSLIIKSYIPEVLGSAKGIVEVEEDVVIESQEAEIVREDAPPIKQGKANLEEFIANAKKRDQKHPKVKPVEPAPEVQEAVVSEQEAVEGEVVSEDRKKLERRYFALLKEVGSDHTTAKSLFGFEHLADLTDQQLIDIVGELSVNKTNSKGN